jgi:quercetin dioxygenase-like cupin family protein
VPAYRLYADDDGRTHLEPLDLLDRPWENGPGDFKGVGGSVLGDASRVMFMRFERGARPPLHRAVPSLAVLLQGELVLNASDGAEVVLAPGDAVRVETTGQGGWRLGNRGDEFALLALVQMPPRRGADADEPAG